MISIISGTVISNNGAELVVMTSGGVGYKIAATPALAKAAKTGAEITADVYLAVREDAMDLYGFANADERRLFKQLLTVSGIGPKSAMHILALGEARDIESAIGRGDVVYLTKVSGIGKKTAERVVVELKGKMDFGPRTAGAGGAKIGEVIEGLVSLGYSFPDAREAVQDLSADLPSEQIMREALKRLSR